MHPCAGLIEEILALCREENTALASEDVDRAEELAGQRLALLEKLGGLRAGYSEKALGASLARLRAEHAILRVAAENLHHKLRQMQNSSRKQSRYFNHDRKIQSQFNRSLYFDKFS